MRGISALLAMAGIFAAGQADIGNVMVPSAGTKFFAPTHFNRKCNDKYVAQAKREAIKLRRRKAHRMHCRGSAS